jgi:hypothetical protein
MNKKEFNKNYRKPMEKIRAEDYVDDECNLLFGRDLLESFKKDSSDGAKKIMKTLESAENSDVIINLRRREAIMNDLYIELKSIQSGKNPLIHNFICDKNLKNHNIKLGFIIHSSFKNSLQTISELISGIVLKDIEFENLTPTDNKTLIPPKFNFNNPSASLKSFAINNKNITNLNNSNNISCIVFMYCNKNMFNYKKIEGLVTEEVFSINENYININVL